MSALSFKKSYRPDAKFKSGERGTTKTYFGLLFGITRLSDAVEAMVVGLKTKGRRHGFGVDMGVYSFLSEQKNVCFGCAATYALCVLLPESMKKKNADLTNWWQGVVNPDHKWMLDAIEIWYNAIRKGYGVDPVSWLYLTNESQERPPLTTEGWLETLPEYEEWVRELREAGL